LIAEQFLGHADLVVTPLEKDLFGFERGFVKFTRDANGSITGFRLMTRHVDAFLGSNFVRLSPD